MGLVLIYFISEFIFIMKCYIATGSTVEKTTQRMKEAIKFHLEGLKEGEIAIPEPSTKAVSIEVTA